MQLKILAFAQLREQLGPSLLIELSAGADVGQLQQRLTELYPDAPALAVARLAVNRSYVADAGQVLHDGDEIALIPPVSGG